MIDVKTEAGIATITMTHGKANALDIEFCDTLAAGFAALRNADVKAVVLTAPGHIFCAGLEHDAQRGRCD